MKLDSKPDFFTDFEEEAPAPSPTPVADQTEQPQAETPAPQASEQPQPKPRRRSGHALRWVVLTIGAMLGVIAYLRYGSPYLTDATDTGYIVSLQREGLVFKTFEGELVSQRAINDTGSVYERNMAFSVEDPQVAAKLRQAQIDSRKVVVSYKRYYGVLPWRGASTIIITAVDYSTSGRSI